MFNDWSWLSNRTDEQEDRMNTWLHSIRGNKILIIEIGSSNYVPTVRAQGKYIIERIGGRDSCLMRINPNDFTVSRENDISVPMRALEALNEIDELLNKDS